MARGHRRRRVRVQHRLRRAPILRHRARVRPSHRLRRLRRARQEAHRVGPRHRRRQGHDGRARAGRHGRVHPIRRTHRVGVDGQSHQDLRSREVVRMRRDSHGTRIVRPGARRPPRRTGRRLPLRKRGLHHPRVEERGGRRRRLRQTRRHRPRPRDQRTGGARALRVARYDRQGVDRGGCRRRRLPRAQRAGLRRRIERVRQQGHHRQRGRYRPRVARQWRVRPDDTAPRVRLVRRFFTKRGCRDVLRGRRGARVERGDCAT